MRINTTILATVALAVMFHHPMLRGRLPVEKLCIEGVCEWGKLSDCYKVWDTLPKAQQQFTWCSDTGDAGGVGTGNDSNKDPKKPVE